MRNILIAGLASLFAVAARAEDCPPSKVDLGSLPRTAAALAKSGELTVVAFGSSSTQGWMSTDAAHAYPTVLQIALEAAFPQAHVAVINRGIGGQDAAEELPRIDSDVNALRPSLVIWQVGANGALRNTDPEVFRRLVSTGIERIKAAGTDIVLMDNQRAPMILASPEHAKIDEILDQVTQEAHVGLFRRGALMLAWQQAGYGAEQFISTDGLHHNDHGYRCIALAVAQGIMAGVESAPSPVLPTPVLTSSVLPPPPPRSPAR